MRPISKLAALGCILGLGAPALPTTAAADVICKARSGLLRLKPACHRTEQQLPISIESDGTVRVTGANVQIVSGAGATAAPVNGKGNLIIGYDENSYAAERTGSHNLVVGPEHTYTSYGGILGGSTNSTRAPHATVSGGRESAALGSFASVCGGFRNTARGESATVSGGSWNEAEGLAASISGGESNIADGASASISGGVLGTASGSRASICGGESNQAVAFAASVSGGIANTSIGSGTSVSGGVQNRASGFASSIAGGLGNVASGGLRDNEDMSNSTAGGSVAGGYNNVASGDDSTVSGGALRQATGTDDWVAGTLFEDD